MPRLKVFQAHLGFFDTVVAAPSQKAALDAWGSRQNLFRDGTASVASDAAAVKAALAKPGVVLKRLTGAQGQFVEEPALPKTPPVSRSPQKRGSKTSPAKKAQPDLSRLHAAQHALSGLREQRKRMHTEFDERETALRDERRARQRELDQKQEELEKQLALERKALHGGG